MGRTNTNVAEHVCSKCHNRRPVHDFPYPNEVWWCRLCWRAHREKQNEMRRQKRLVALEEYLSRPRATNWRVVRYRSKGGLAALSPSDQQLTEAEFKRLFEECKREGRPLTPHKIRSLMANAIFIVKYARTGKVLGWMGNYWKRRKQWKHLRENQQVEQSRAKLIRQRSKVLDTGW